MSAGARNLSPDCQRGDPPASLFCVEPLSPLPEVQRPLSGAVLQQCPPHFLGTAPLLSCWALGLWSQYLSLSRCIPLFSQVQIVVFVKCAWQDFLLCFVLVCWFFLDLASKNVLTAAAGPWSQGHQDRLELVGR